MALTADGEGALEQRSSTDGWVSLTGKVTPATIRGLRSKGPIDKLSFTSMPLLTVRVAQALSSLQSVDHFWLWCSVTRTAMRHVVAIPGLRVLDVLKIVKPGWLGSFSAAATLEVIRSNLSLTEEDVLAVLQCKSVRELGIQGAELSPRVIRAILAHSNLTTLDLESTQFDDSMAEAVSTSSSISAIDLGATRLTRAGLGHLCRMKQLRALDLWATPINERDLELLAQLPNLEYLSVGGYEGDSTFSADTLLPRLTAMPALKRIWLDGVKLGQSQRESLEARYTSVRVT